MIVAMLVGSAFAYLLAVTGVADVPAVGALPSALPSLSSPSFELRDWQTLGPAVVALTLLALAQSVSLARAVAVKSGQRIDANQEFIGQGLLEHRRRVHVGLSVVRAPSTGSGSTMKPVRAHRWRPSFRRCSCWPIVLVAAPLAAHLPLAVMAALLFVVAWGLIDLSEIRKIIRVGHGEAWVLAVTFLATLALRLDFAILAGVLASLLVYLEPNHAPATDSGGAGSRLFVAALRTGRRHRRCRLANVRN
jgi:SulP family sulfate permease